MNRSKPLTRTAPLAAVTPLVSRTGLQRSWPLDRTGQPGRGAPLATRTPLQRSQPIAPVSGRRREENRQRRALAAEIAGGERPLCDVWLLVQPEWCTQLADDWHEALSRARGGSITDLAIARFVCRACHDVLTFTPESELQWAYDAGLLMHSWDAAAGGAA